MGSIQSIVATADVMMTSMVLDVTLVRNTYGTGTLGVFDSDLICAAYEQSRSASVPRTSDGHFRPDGVGHNVKFPLAQLRALAGDLPTVTVTMPPLSEEFDGTPFTSTSEYKVGCHVRLNAAPHDMQYLYLEETSVLVPPTPTWEGSAVTLPTGIAILKEHIGVGGQVVFPGGLVWHSFTDVFSDWSIFVTPLTSVEGTTYELKCSGKVCEFAIALYQCAACTGPQPGGLAQHLMLEGWVPSSCGPRFDVAGEGNFGTKLYRRQIDATGGEVVIPLTIPEYNVIITIIEGPPVASSFCQRAAGPHPSTGSCGNRCPPATVPTPPQVP